VYPRSFSGVVTTNQEPVSAYVVLQTYLPAFAFQLPFYHPIT